MIRQNFWGFGPTHSVSSVDSVCEWKQEIKPKLSLSAFALMLLKLLYFSTVWFRCGWMHLSSFLQLYDYEHNSVNIASSEPVYLYIVFINSKRHQRVLQLCWWWILWSNGLHIKGPQWLQRPVFHQTGIILKPLGHSWISSPEIVLIYFVSHFYPFLSCWNR